MGERDISNILSSQFMSTAKYKIPNLYIYNWESDLLIVSKSLLSYEMEIKVSKKDFDADAKKAKKHSILRDVKYDNAPNYFYYVSEPHVIPQWEVPKHAGLIYIINRSYPKKIIEAPKLRDTRFNINLYGDKFYYNWKDSRRKAIERESVDPVKLFNSGRKTGIREVEVLAERAIQEMCPYCQFPEGPNRPMCTLQKIIGDTRREYTMCFLECDRAKRCLTILKGK